MNNSKASSFSPKESEDSILPIEDMSSPPKPRHVRFKLPTSTQTICQRGRQLERSSRESAQASADIPSRDSPAHNMQVSAPAPILRDENGGDIRDAIIRKCLQKLGPFRVALSYSAIVIGCQMALEGLGPPDIKDQVIATLAWQAAQIERVHRLLIHLHSERMMREVPHAKLAYAALMYRKGIAKPVIDAFRKDNKLQSIRNPPVEGFWSVNFYHAHRWLLAVLCHNHLMYPPGKFYLKRVVKEVVTFLA